MTEPFEGYEIGTRYHLHRQIWKSSPGFGINIGGIAPKGQYPKTEAVYILATVGENVRYGNRWDRDVLVFVGEDVKAGGPERTIIDQDPEKGGNRVLTHSRELGIPIYCFWAREQEEDWLYLGLGEVESWSKVENKGRMQVEYRFAFLGVPSLAAAVEQRKRIEEEVSATSPPKLVVPGGREREGTTRRVRSQAFSDLVKKAYSERCAICGEARWDAQGRPEVQAAHIYPVEKEGPDDVRNGLALCRFHHWAFDGALIGIDTGLVIRVFEPGRSTAGISGLDGVPLAALPSEVARRPHQLFLEARFRLSRRGWTRGSEGDAE
jgi:putative restriction endonuclease